jgi:hypothetical protein
MDNYLGEFERDISTTGFAKYKPRDWALYYIASYGQIDGERRKLWLLDQVARILNGTPMIVKYAMWGPSEEAPEGFEEARVETGEPSKKYLAWVEMMRGEYDEDEENYEYGYEDGSS